MKKEKNLSNYLGHTMVAVSLLSLFYVSVLAWFSPYEVMLLVGERLTNTDSMSSIRGVYGGAGLFIVAIFVFLWRQDLKITLHFLSLFWLLYACSRIVTWVVDGPLGNFGNQWLIIESCFGLFCFAISYFVKIKDKNTEFVLS